MVITRILDLPHKVKGFVTKDSNDDYNIYINARLSDAEQLEAYVHEMAHVNYGHLCSERPVSEMDKEVAEGQKSPE